MSPEERRDARARCEGATEGPWAASYSRSAHGTGYIGTEGWGKWSIRVRDNPRDEDLDFIAEARTDLPAALDALDARDALLARCLDAIHHSCDWRGAHDNEMDQLIRDLEALR